MCALIHRGGQSEELRPLGLWVGAHRVQPQRVDTWRQFCRDTIDVAYRIYRGAPMAPTGFPPYAGVREKAHRGRSRARDDLDDLTDAVGVERRVT